MAGREAVVFDKNDPSSPSHYTASQTAVLLMDFHSLFVEKVGGVAAKDAAQQAAKLRKWAKDNGILVVHCLVDGDDTPFRTCKGAERLGGFVKMMRDNPEQIKEPEELRGDPAEEPLVVRTPGHVSALKSKGFNELLQSRGITSLVMCGLSTSGCVMRTSFAAADAEYVVTVIEDACADPTEGLHKTLVDSVLPSRSHCCNLDQFTREWLQK